MTPSCECWFRPHEAWGCAGAAERPSCRVTALAGTQGSLDDNSDDGALMSQIETVRRYGIRREGPYPQRGACSTEDIAGVQNGAGPLTPGSGGSAGL